MGWLNGKGSTCAVLILALCACTPKPEPQPPTPPPTVSETPSPPPQASAQNQPQPVPEEFRGAPPEVLKAIAGVKLPASNPGEVNPGAKSDAQEVPAEFRGAPAEVLKAIAGAKLPGVGSAELNPGSPGAAKPGPAPQAATTAVPPEFKGAPPEVLRGLVNAQQQDASAPGAQTAIDALATAQGAYTTDPNAELEAQALTMMMTASSPGGGSSVPVPSSRPVPPPAKTRPATPPPDLAAPVYPSLLDAAKAGAAEDVENHILRGAAMDVMDKEGRSALYLAINADNQAVVDVLLDYGANPNLNESGDSANFPLIPVLERKQWALAKRLRERGATEMPHVAAANGDLEALKEYVSEDASVLAFMDPMQHSLAFFAAAGGHKETLAYLLANGVPLLAGRDGYTPFLVAAIKGHAEVVRYLVKEQHIDPNERGPQSRTALHCLVELGRADGLDLLKEVGADLNARDQDGATPLHLAVTQRSITLATRLLELGASMAVGDTQGRTPLHAAVLNDSAELITLLLEHGADIEAQDSAGDRPVHTAARSARPKLLALLLERGAHLDVTNKEGLTPLHCAAEGDEVIMARATAERLQLGELMPGSCRPNRLKTVDALLDRGVSVSVPAPRGTPLVAAAAVGQDGVVTHLLAKGASIEETDDTGRSALAVACIRDRPSTVALLLAKGANPAHLDSAKHSAVFHASTLRNPEPLQALLGVIANANETDADGRTPLHAAAEHGSASIVQLLLASRAKVNQPDREGLYPIHLAAERLDADPLRTLLANKADFRVKDRAGRTPLRVAAQTGRWEATQLLVGLWPESVNMTASDGTSPLHAAAASSGIRAAEILLAAGAKPMALDPKKRTPLDVAIERKDEHMALALAAKIQASGKAVPETLSAAAKAALADPLFTALASGTTAAIGPLVKEKPERLEKPIAGWTPLLWAVALGNIDAVRALRVAGAQLSQSVDAYDGGTPLHYAVRDGSLDLIKALGSAEALASSADGAGKTPLGLAEEAGLTSIIRHLQGSPR